MSNPDLLLIMKEGRIGSESNFKDGSDPDNNRPDLQVRVEYTIILMLDYCSEYDVQV